MARRGRVLIGIVALALGLGLLGLHSQGQAEEPDPSTGHISVAEAIARARETGDPVVASALTDEYTLVTAELTAGLPGSWGPGVPNKKGVGTRWFDPSNPGNGVRIDQGFPGSPQLSKRVDHVVVRSGGKVIGPDGKPIVGPLSDNPQAHIPLTDWMSWSSWSAP